MKWGLIIGLALAVHAAANSSQPEASNAIPEKLPVPGSPVLSNRVECVYDALTPAERTQVSSAINNLGTAQQNDEGRSLFRSKADQCNTAFGWTTRQKMAAAVYFVQKLNGARARADYASAGLPAGLPERIFRQFTPAQHASYSQLQISEPMQAIMAREYLKSVPGAARFPPATMRKHGTLVGRVLAAMELDATSRRVFSDPTYVNAFWEKQFENIGN